MTTLAYILLIALVILLVDNTRRKSYDDGIHDGYEEGTKEGFNNGVNRTLQLLRLPVMKKYGFDVADYFQELMNDEDLLKATFGTQKIDEDETSS